MKNDFDNYHVIEILDRHTVRKCLYAENIWIYLTEFYKQSDQIVQIIALRKLIIWQMKLSHTVKKADQEVCYLADWIH